ncbi:MAG: DUF983 domain-containing protein [Bacteroidota bacterium]
MENAETTAKKQNLAFRILTEKCPHCGKGQVFKKRENILQLPVMYERCKSCNYFFDREPGYFLGAMYISYGLAVLQGIITFLICHFFFKEMETLMVCIVLVAVVLLFSMKNYKLSRVIYIHIFPG